MGFFFVFFFLARSWPRCEARAGRYGWQLRGRLLLRPPASPAACSHVQRLGSAAGGLGTLRASPSQHSLCPFSCGAKRGDSRSNSVPRAEAAGGEEPPSPAAWGWAGEPGTPGHCPAPHPESVGKGSAPGVSSSHGGEGWSGGGMGARGGIAEVFCMCLDFFYYYLFFSFSPPFLLSVCTLVFSVPAHPTLPPDPAIPALASPCH